VGRRESDIQVLETQQSTGNRGLYPNDVVWAGTRLPYLRTFDMVFPTAMKTTLNIDDTVFTRLKTEAASSGRTMSELVESALRLLLTRGVGAMELPPLPSFDGGGATIDIADREHPSRAREGR
jgi:hypothetical protein